jgi:hypothetical protein
MLYIDSRMNQTCIVSSQVILSGLSWDALPVNQAQNIEYATVNSPYY